MRDPGGFLDNLPMMTSAKLFVEESLYVCFFCFFLLLLPEDQFSVCIVEKANFNVDVKPAR